MGIKSITYYYVHVLGIEEYEWEAAAEAETETAEEANKLRLLLNLLATSIYFYRGHQSRNNTATSRERILGKFLAVFGIYGLTYFWQ